MLHMSSHTDSPPARCMRNSCNYYKPDNLHAHLPEFQSFYTDGTAPINITFFSSPVSGCTQSTSEWTDHVRLHSEAVTQTYGPIFVNGLMTTPRRFSYCVKAGMYDEFEQKSDIHHVKCYLFHHFTCFRIVTIDVPSPHALCESVG